MAPKVSKVDAAIKAVRKAHGAASALLLNEDCVLHSEVEEVIPTGIDSLDWYGLQIGGLAVGRISELFSAEGKGKTSLGLQELAACQKDGGIAVLLEVEHATQRARLETFDLDLDELIVFEPESLEQGLGMIGTFLGALPDGVGPVLFVWDSLAGTMCEAEVLQGPDGKPAQPGSMARVMADKLKRLLPILAKKRAHLQFINQTREKIGVMFGSPEYTPGGRALGFYASQRIRIGAGKKIADASRGGDQVGHEANIKIYKNRFGIPHREVHTCLIYEEGWDNDWTNRRLAKKWKLVAPGCSDGAKARAELDAVEWSSLKASEVAETRRLEKEAAAEAAAEAKSKKAKKPKKP